MNKSKLMTLGLAVVIALSSFGGIAAAAVPAQEETLAITPRAEIRGYKYKTLNGVEFKRLWSYTYMYWVDPQWTVA